MEENFKSKIGFSIFIIFILFLLIGGYFFTKYMTDEDYQKKVNKNTFEDVNYKIDKDKDYIYFVNEKVISEDANLIYKDAVINILGEEELTENLEDENKENKNTIKYISDVEGIDRLDDIYKYDNLYYLYHRNYEVYEFDKYVSLVIKDYAYSCYDLLTFKSTKSYVYDVNKGVRLSNDDLLKIFNVTIDEIKEKIREELNKSQTAEDGVEVIKIDETLNNFNNYSLYVNDLGKLCITYLVKSIEKDYNLSMEVFK